MIHIKTQIFISTLLIFIKDTFKRKEMQEKKINNKNTNQNAIIEKIIQLK